MSHARVLRLAMLALAALCCLAIGAPSAWALTPPLSARSGQARVDRLRARVTGDGPAVATARSVVNDAARTFTQATLPSQVGPWPAPSVPIPASPATFTLDSSLATESVKVYSVQLRAGDEFTVLLAPWSNVDFMSLYGPGAVGMWSPLTWGWGAEDGSVGLWYQAQQTGSYTLVVGNTWSYGTETMHWEVRRASALVFEGPDPLRITELGVSHGRQHVDLRLTDMYSRAALPGKQVDIYARAADGLWWDFIATVQTDSGGRAYYVPEWSGPMYYAASYEALDDGTNAASQTEHPCFVRPYDYTITILNQGGPNGPWSEDVGGDTGEIVRIGTAPPTGYHMESVTVDGVPIDPGIARHWVPSRDHSVLTTCAPGLVPSSTSITYSGRPRRGRTLTFRGFGSVGTSGQDVQLLGRIPGSRRWRSFGGGVVGITRQWAARATLRYRGTYYFKARIVGLGGVLPSTSRTLKVVVR